MRNALEALESFALFLQVSRLLLKTVDFHPKLTLRGGGVKLGVVYAAIPRLSLYSMGLSEPRDILIRFSLYQRI